MKLLEYFTAILLTVMDHGDSPASSLQSTGDTGQLLQELLNLQKSNGTLSIEK